VSGENYLIKRIDNNLIDLLNCMCDGVTIIPSNGVYVIEKPGIYKLSGNTSACIEIYADDVLLDLSGATLCGDCDPLIKVLPERRNVKIINGVLKGQSDCSNRGIEIQCPNDDIEIRNLSIYFCSIGIDLNGALDCPIKGVRVADSKMHDCKIGISLKWAFKSVFDKCEVYNSVVHAFELFNSEFNVFDNCKALQTVNSDPDGDAIGFYSTRGRANLFRECVVEGTTKTEGGFYNNAVGFLLTGSCDIMERETKIIDSVVNTTKIETGDGFAYGIKLEAALCVDDLPANKEDNYEHGADVHAIEWSPNCNFIALVGDVGTGGHNIRALRFLDGQIVDIPSAVALHGDRVNSVAWSSEGNYIVVGVESQDNGQEIKIYSFDGLYFESLNSFVNNHNATVYSVSWSPVERFIAVGGETAPDFAQVRVFNFLYDEILAPIASATYDHGATVYSVDWSPNGRFLAIGGDESGADGFGARVLKFDGAFLTPLAGANYDHVATVSFVKWSPTGAYLAIGGAVGADDKTVRVLKFNGVVLQELPAATYGKGAAIKSLAWSPNGRYLVVAGENDDNDDEVRILQFDGTSLIEIPGLVYDHNHVINTVSWTNHGFNLAVGGNVAQEDLVVFSVMNYPTKCLIDGNKICNTQRYGFGAIGISGSSVNNMIIRNICYENDVNVSEGVFNTSFDGLVGSISNSFFNIAVPPY